MGQFPQDGENGQNVAFILFFLKLELFQVWEKMVLQIIIAIIANVINFKQL